MTAIGPQEPPGIFSMSITPFSKSGGLDEGALRAHLRFMAGANVGVFLGSYGSGEGHLLREREIERLYEVGVEELKGKAPVYASALGFTETDHVIAQAKRAAAIGVDAVQVHPPRPGPSAIRPTQEELTGFYRDVLETVTTPVILTNQMVMVGYEVPVELFAALVAQYPNVIGINTVQPDFPYLVRLVDAVGAKVAVRVGHIGQLVTALALGARGAVCFEPNVAPRLCASVVSSYRRGDYGEALQGFSRVMRLNAVLMKYQNPRSLKAALKVLGRPGGELRRPYLGLNEAATRDIAETLARLCIRELEGLA